MEIYKYVYKVMNFVFFLILNVTWYIYCILYCKFHWMMYETSKAQSAVICFGGTKINPLQKPQVIF